MKQYEFALFKGTAKYTVFCTSQTVEKALLAVKDYYQEFELCETPIAEYKAHYIYTEIDATA